MNIVAIPYFKPESLNKGSLSLVSAYHLHSIVKKETNFKSNFIYNLLNSILYSLILHILLIYEDEIRNGIMIVLF